MEQGQNSIEKPIEKRRITKACTACHKSHISCEESKSISILYWILLLFNLERPCSRCLKKGITCEEYIPRKKGRRKKDESQILSNSISLLNSNQVISVIPQEIQSPLLRTLFEIMIWILNDSIAYEAPIDLPEDLFTFFFPSTNPPENQPQEFRVMVSCHLLHLISCSPFFPMAQKTLK